MLKYFQYNIWQDAVVPAAFKREHASVFEALCGGSMNTTQMKCFLSLAKTLSFSDTAGSLYLSQQAVSKNIANLESELGVRLFERDHHRVSLSEEGKRYYGFFLRFAEEFEELKNDIDSSRSVKPVQLRCGYQIGLDMGPVPYDVQKTTQNNYPGFTHICERRSPLILQQMLLEKELDLVVIYKNFIKQNK